MRRLCRFPHSADFSLAGIFSAPSGFPLAGAFFALHIFPSAGAFSAPSGFPLAGAFFALHSFPSASALSALTGFPSAVPSLSSHKNDTLTPSPGVNMGDALTIPPRMRYTEYSLKEDRYSAKSNAPPVIAIRADSDQSNSATDQMPLSDRYKTRIDNIDRYRLDFI